MTEVYKTSGQVGGLDSGGFGKILRYSTIWKLKS